MWPPFAVTVSWRGTRHAYFLMFALYIHNHNWTSHQSPVKETKNTLVIFNREFNKGNWLNGIVLRQKGNIKVMKINTWRKQLWPQWLGKQREELISKKNLQAWRVPKKLGIRPPQRGCHHLLLYLSEYEAHSSSEEIAQNWNYILPLGQWWQKQEHNGRIPSLFLLQPSCLPLFLAFAEPNRKCSHQREVALTEPQS